MLQFKDINCVFCDSGIQKLLLESMRWNCLNYTFIPKQKWAFDYKYISRKKQTVLH